MSEGLLSTPRAAEYLGISNVTLHRAVKRGIIRPAMATPGGNLRFSQQELDRYVRESVANVVAFGAPAESQVHAVATK